jgi:hypothetical protein
MSSFPATDSALGVARAFGVPHGYSISDYVTNNTPTNMAAARNYEGLSIAIYVEPKKS